MGTDAILDHLGSALRRLDVLLHREILRLRAAYQLSLDEFRGLYVSDEQVDQLIDQALGRAEAGQTTAVREMSERAEELRRASDALAGRLGDDLPWNRLAVEFGLSPFEQDVLLLALAPEIDLKYETLYAYLNNDVTRRWPTFDLALRLFSPTPAERLLRRGALLPDSPLFAGGLLRPVAAPAERPAWLAGGFAPAPAVAPFLLGGLAPLDPALAGFVAPALPEARWEDVPVPDEQRAHLGRLAALLGSAASPDHPAPILVLEGRPGAGRRAAAEAICRDLGCPTLLCVDLEALRAAPEPPRLSGLILQQRLLGAGLYLQRGEALFDRENQRFAAEIRALLAPTVRAGGRPLPVFLAVAPGCAWREGMPGRRALALAFGDPDYRERCRLWKIGAAREGVPLSDTDIEALANRFVLTPGQIREALAGARDRSLLRGTNGTVTAETLMAAARDRSDQSLGSLAVKVTARHAWEDLVLPPATLRRVREVAAAIGHRHIVYAEWGFGRRVASGRGLKVLFTGASGTGKTMTAGVIAGDLGLDLYKIDLSSLVSKYIGETEKNLERIFRAAHSSNAILFFDEADSLFGKRSEVKDAHDRYANIEISYLLQRMEEFEGIVILASNLSKNIDEAFSRRMHYIIEFPLPGEEHRERLWRGMFPPEVPLGPDVDCGFLAKQFPLAGGDIRNVALDAAFLAAQDGRVITMTQLIQAMARQMLKQGRIPSAADFKQYHALIARGE